MYIQELIDERRDLDKKTERHDLFSSLLEANLEEDEGSRTRLDDSELIGIFIFFLKFIGCLKYENACPDRKHIHFPSCGS